MPSLHMQETFISGMIEHLVVLNSLRDYLFLFAVLGYNGYLIKFHNSGHFLDA